MMKQQALKRGAPASAADQRGTVLAHRQRTCFPPQPRQQSENKARRVDWTNTEKVFVIARTSGYYRFHGGERKIWLLESLEKKENNLKAARCTPIADNQKCSIIHIQSRFLLI